MKSRTILTAVAYAAVLAYGSLSAAVETDPNSLTPEEKAAGFVLLFNGRDFEGWKNPGGWVIESGSFAMKRPTPGSVAGNGRLTQFREAVRWNRRMRTMRNGSCQSYNPMDRWIAEGGNREEMTSHLVALACVLWCRPLRGEI